MSGPIHEGKCSFNSTESLPIMAKLPRPDRFLADALFELILFANEGQFFLQE